MQETKSGQCDPASALQSSVRYKVIKIGSRLPELSLGFTKVYGYISILQQKALISYHLHSQTLLFLYLFMLFFHFKMYLLNGCGWRAHLFEVPFVGCIKSTLYNPFKKTVSLINVLQVPLYSPWKKKRLYQRRQVQITNWNSEFLSQLLVSLLPVCTQ